MDDFELFEAMNEAEKRYDELRNEFRKRGLHKKPYCEFSHFRDADIPWQWEPSNRSEFGGE